MPMSDKKRWIRLAVAAGLGAAAGAWTYQIEKDKKAENYARLAAVEAAVVRSRDYVPFKNISSSFPSLLVLSQSNGIPSFQGNISIYSRCV